MRAPTPLARQIWVQVGGDAVGGVDEGRGQALLGQEAAGPESGPGPELGFSQRLLQVRRQLQALPEDHKTGRGFPQRPGDEDQVPDLSPARRGVWWAGTRP